MLDHYIYKIIYRNNYKVFQLDSFIMHSLSIENFEESITPDRYSSMVDSEFLLLKNSSILNKTIFSVRLIYRMIKQSFYSNKIFYKITFNKLIGK